MRVGLRQKLNFVIVSLLSLTAGGIAFSTADLFISDFTQFSYKNTLDAAGLLSSRVQIQMRHLLSHVTTLTAATIEDFRYEEDKLRFIEDNLKRESHFLGITLYRRSGNHFTAVWRAINPDIVSFTKDSFAELEKSYPLDVESISKGNVAFVVSKLTDDTPSVRIGFPVIQSAPGEFSHLVVAELRYEVLVSVLSESTEHKAFLVDRNGIVLASNSPDYYKPGDNLHSSPLFQLTRTQHTPQQKLIRGKFNEEQIAAYQRVGFADLAILSQTPLSKIQEAKSQVLIRTSLLGASMLFFALFITFRLSGAITGPLQALSQAAHRIGQGDFSVRVKVPPSGSRLKNDEVATLSNSFNLMANRIGELMLETAQKARMEKELETAKSLQTLFLPQADFEHPHLKLSGTLQPASECGGDWWNYAQLGEYLLVLMGDVTGHGVSSALLTAAAQGVYSLFIEDLRESLSKGLIGTPESWLEKLSRELNTALRGTGNKQAGMAVSASLIHLPSGAVFSANFSNRAPFIMRKTPRRHSDVYGRYQPLTNGQTSCLGEKPSVELQIHRHELEPGDLVIWYTDGLVECTNSSSEDYGKRRLINFLNPFVEQGEANPTQICSALMDDLEVFRGPDQRVLGDDITLTIAAVPMSASFSRVKPAA